MHGPNRAFQSLGVYYVLGGICPRGYVSRGYMSGGVLSCHRACYGALACKDAIKNAYRKHSRLESKISLCVHTIYLMKINPAAYHPENAHN